MPPCWQRVVAISLSLSLSPVASLPSSVTAAAYFVLQLSDFFVIPTFAKTLFSIGLDCVPANTPQQQGLLVPSLNPKP